MRPEQIDVDDRPRSGVLSLSLLVTFLVLSCRSSPQDDTASESLSEFRSAFAPRHPCDLGEVLSFVAPTMSDGVAGSIVLESAPGRRDVIVRSLHHGDEIQHDRYVMKVEPREAKVLAMNGSRPLTELAAHSAKLSSTDAHPDEVEIELTDVRGVDPTTDFEADQLRIVVQMEPFSDELRPPRRAR